MQIYELYKYLLRHAIMQHAARIYNIKEHKPLHIKDENWPDSDPPK